MNANDLIVRIAADLNVLTEHLVEFVQQTAEKKPSSRKAEKKEAVVPSLEEVRTVLAQKSRDGYTDEVRKLITDCGVNALSEVDPSKYADLMAKAKEIGTDA